LNNYKFIHEERKNHQKEILENKEKQENDENKKLNQSLEEIFDVVL